MSCALYECVWRPSSDGLLDGALGMHPSLLGGFLTPPVRASTKRFLFLMMPKRRDWAKSVSESSNDLNKAWLGALALWSVAGMDVPLLAHDISTVGRTVETAAVRWSRVLVSVVPK